MNVIYAWYSDIAMCFVSLYYILRHFFIIGVSAHYATNYGFFYSFMNVTPHTLTIPTNGDYCWGADRRAAHLQNSGLR